MSASVDSQELRRQTGALLKRVANGEVITVRDRGRPIARIVPYDGGPLDQLVSEGRATVGDGDLLGLAEELGLPAPASGGMSLSKALTDLRADER
jgi:prevent-host-death family protein